MFPVSKSIKYVKDECKKKKTLYLNSEDRNFMIEELSKLCSDIMTRGGNIISLSRSKSFIQKFKDRFKDKESYSQYLSDYIFLKDNFIQKFIDNNVKHLISPELLCAAVEENYDALVQAICDYGVDINKNIVQPDYKYNPLYKAMFMHKYHSGSKNIIEILRKYGANSPFFGRESSRYVGYLWYDVTSETLGLDQ